MKNKEPINTYKSPKFKDAILDSSHLISIKKYKGSFNETFPFVKPISKII